MTKTTLTLAIAISAACAQSMDGPKQDAGTIGFGDGGVDSSTCASTCSDDLTGVVDCHGNPVSTCAPGLACGSDLSCGDPCAATESLKSSVGCHYSVPPPSVYSESNGSCFTALVANAWTEPVSLQVSYGGKSFDIGSIARIASSTGTLSAFPSDGKLPPKELAVVFLADNAAAHSGTIACPSGIQAAVMSVDTGLVGSGTGETFSIVSSGPIVTYDMFPYGGASSYLTSASLILPTTAWGQTYSAVHAYEIDTDLEKLNPQIAPYFQVMAAADTTVTIWPTADMVTEDGGVAPKGLPYQANIAAGHFLQFSGPDLTGSPISATGAIGVVGGSNCMHIPIGIAACDSGHQQLLPVNSLGSVYVGARHRDRVAGANESVAYRILGEVENTTLTFDPPIAHAPSLVGAGKLVTFWTDRDFVVKSQDIAHPFYMSAHMSGARNIASADGGTNNQGDPDFVNVVTPDQFKRSYLFLTDPTYANTHLVVVRKRNDSGAFDDVTLDCVGTLGGWAPVGGADQFETTKVDLVVDKVGVGACGNGVHSASSKTPFAVTVWGWDVFVSYAYPAGTFIQKTNSIDITPK